MTKVDTIKDSALLRKIAAEYAKSIGLKDFPLELESSRIEATKSKTPVNEETILNYPYFGERYAFFKLSDIDSETISVSATDANIFKTLVDNYEYVKDVTYFLVGSKLIGLSRHFIWISSYTKGHFANYAPTMEQTGIMNKMQSFLPYASETLRSLYYKEYKNKIAYGKGIRIFTEGPTDWKHLKYHWTYLKNDKKWKWYQLDIDFHEYESTNSSQEAEFKIDMGGDALCDMCQATSQMENEDIRIFIADRDKENVIKKLMDKETPFKYWGNNVYSIVLPIPPHRTQTPKICIEHYYSDNEIKLEFDCRDGIKRRLYMGNEFDKYGRAVEINRFCINREACGVDSIRIINGSEKERVISLTDNSANINYALSKMQYVDSICSEDIELESGTIEAFASLFELILAIKTHNNELTASK